MNVVVITCVSSVYHIWDLNLHMEKGQTEVVDQSITEKSKDLVKAVKLKAVRTRVVRKVRMTGPHKPGTPPYMKRLKADPRRSVKEEIEHKTLVNELRGMVQAELEDSKQKLKAAAGDILREILGEIETESSGMDPEQMELLINQAVQKALSGVPITAGVEKYDTQADVRYIPGSIVPTDAKASIKIEDEESGSVDESLAALKKMRKGGKK